MKYLAIDTSGKNLTIAVCNGTSPLVYSDENCGVKHSVEVMVKTEEMLNNHRTNEEQNPLVLFLLC